MVVSVGDPKNIETGMDLADLKPELPVEMNHASVATPNVGHDHFETQRLSIFNLPFFLLAA